jgi:putative ABC transport system substrate-binding protein
MRALAKELVGLQPDIICTGTTPAVLALQRETRTIPIVYAGAGDPVASGIVARLNQPGGNVTGFAGLEPSLAGKWLELLSEIAPGPVHSDLEIETAIIALGREPGGGLVVMPDVFTAVHRAPLILAAARNNVPAVYGPSYFARDGGLLSYGPDPVDIWRRVPSYVDRILRGAKPGDLPVQFPTRFEMAVNLKTAKALGLAVPPSIMLRADEVIE